MLVVDVLAQQRRVGEMRQIHRVPGVENNGQHAVKAGSLRAVGETHGDGGGADRSVDVDGGRDVVDAPADVRQTECARVENGERCSLSNRNRVEIRCTDVIMSFDRRLELVTT